MKKSLMAFFLISAFILLSSFFSADILEEPPCILYFRTTEQLQELLEATELTEEEFTEFLNTKQPDYTVNGIRSKEDAIRIIEETYDIKLPVPTSATILSIDYYVESKKLDITLDNASTVIVSVTIDQPTADFITDKTITVFDNIYPVYKIKTDSTNRLQYITEVDSNYISIAIYTQDEKLAERILSEMEISSLRILASQSKSTPDSPTDNQETVTDDTTTEPTPPETIEPENPNTSDDGLFNLFITLFSFIILQCIMFLVKKQKTH